MKMIGFEKPFKLEEGNLFKVYEQRKPTPENDDILVKVNKFPSSNLKGFSNPIIFISFHRKSSVIIYIFK
ncbi:zinc-type alcohol dehydrogenase-like protein [Staphylococcus aureus T16619]|nr:zinc-type alcohol dehydrogenase-like protein [Staphylococcus aureus T16619]